MRLSEGSRRSTTRSTYRSINKIEFGWLSMADQLPCARPMRQQAPNSKLQAPKKHQAPSSKTDPRAVGPGICSWGLGLEIWNFSGAWGLVLGVSFNGGEKTDVSCAKYCITLASATR